MTQLDLYDEAVITADAADVYRAVVDEMSGRTDWWAPHGSMELLAG